jgi:hypothetical protein
LTDENQQIVCEKYSTTFLNAAENSICGVAISTLSLRPLNGLRHPPAADTTGWYIWGGEYSDDADFFQPLHTKHLQASSPEIVKFLGLPAGFRWLIDCDHEDVWFDETLLDMD